MKLRTYTSLFLAILVYTISIIIGLIKGFPLLDVFLKGIIITIMTTIMVWAFIFLLEYLADKDNSESIDRKNPDIDRDYSTGVENNVEDKNRQSEAEDEENINTKEDFSPLVPPVLEFAQQEPERGEGN